MQFFYNCKALTGFFVDLVFTPERLKFPFLLSISVVDCRRHILPSCMVAGKSKIFIEWKNFSIKSLVLNNSIFFTFSFFAEDCKMWGTERHCFLHEFEIKVVFILKVSCFLFARSWNLTLKGFPLFAHWRGSQKFKTFSFVQWFGGFSYAIQEKFTAWRVNSMLNFTW